MLVLHVIDAAGPQACPTTLALLAGSLSSVPATESKVLLLGGQPLRRAADAVGLIPGPHVRALNVLTGRAPCGFFTVRHHVPTFLAGRRPDLVHCWSVGSLILASVAWRSVPRLLTLTLSPSRRELLWLRTILRDTPGHSRILAASATVRRAVLAGGMAPELVHVLPPGIALNQIQTGQRSEIRGQWKLADEPATVVALLSDPPAAADAAFAAMVLSLANDSRKPGQPRLHLLVHPDQRHGPRARRLILRLTHNPPLIVDDRLAQPWEVLPSCDLALAAGPAAGGLSLSWAMAAGIPIVGEATYAISEQVEDRYSALLAKPKQAHALARRIGEMVSDSVLAWRLRDTARTQAFSTYSPSRYRQALQIAYTQFLAGEPIDLPPLPVTGGMRFSGRGG